MSAVGNYEIVSHVETVPIPGNSYSFQVDAPSGKKILGVGWSLAPEVRAHYPINDGTSWVFETLTSVFQPQDLTVYLICAEMGC